jgi:ribonuclease Z
VTRLIFLGTSAALPQRDRANTAFAVLAEGTSAGTGGLLVDCGGDIYQQLLQAQIPLDAIADLFITHAHIDHLGGLPSLLESWRLGGRMAPLRIVALPSVIGVVRKLIATYDFELELDHWTYDVALLPTESGESLTLGGWPAHVLEMDHSVPTAGVRLELPGGALAYTCDTQPTPAIAELGRGARLLVTECTYPAGMEALARTSRHLTAAEAGEAAATCGAARLALVHLGPWPPDALRDQVAVSFSGPVLIPNDLDSTEV